MEIGQVIIVSRDFYFLVILTHIVGPTNPTLNLTKTLTPILTLTLTLTMLPNSNHNKGLIPNKTNLNDIAYHMTLIYITS